VGIEPNADHPELLRVLVSLMRRRRSGTAFGDCCVQVWPANRTGWGRSWRMAVGQPVWIRANPL